MRLRPSTGAGALGISTNISVDGVVPAPLVGVGAMLPRWYNDAGNVLLFFNNDSDELQTIDLDTNVVTTVDPAGTTTLAAGNDLYVAGLSSGALQGVRSNIPGWTRLSLAGLGDMDENGDFAVIQNFAADNGVSIYSAAGTHITTIAIPIAPSAVIRCKTGLCAFSGAASSWQLRSLTTGALVPFADRATGVIETVPIELADGRIFVVERTGNDTLTVREATGNQGYVISSTIVFNPDVIELSPGVLRIGWSSAAGEFATSLRMADLTLGSGAQTLWSTSTGTLVSSAGPTAPVTALPATMTGQGLIDTFLGRTAFVKPDGMLTEYGWQFLEKLVKGLGQPVDLAHQTTGVLPGGSVDPDLSVLDGANIIDGSTPLTALESQPASTLVGRGSASAGSPEVITLGTGLTMVATVLNASGGMTTGYWTPLCAGDTLNWGQINSQVGEWSPLTNGDPVTPELIFNSDGDCIAVYTQLLEGPYLPPLVDNEADAIAVWVPTP